MCHGACAVENTGEEQSEATRKVVEAAEARMCETVEKLRTCPPETFAEAAREDLMALMPHLEEALEALEDIERRRSLTDKELTQRRAFRTLLARKGWTRQDRPGLLR
jgi:hypothetical protein